MESSVFKDFDNCIVSLQQGIVSFRSLKEKCEKLEKEKMEALQKCAELEIKIERLNKENCSNCIVLINKLNKERKEKEMLKREEKAKLLKTIAKTLESLEEGNTNQMTSAQQLYTQLVCGGLNNSPERKEKKNISLIKDNDESEDENDSSVLVNETIIAVESEDSSNDFNSKFGQPVVVPETQLQNSFMPEARNDLKKHKHFKYSKLQNSRIENGRVLKENIISSEEEVEIQPLTKKLKWSPANEKVKSLGAISPLRVDIEENVTNRSPPATSPSVLSEIIEAVGGTSYPRSNEVNSGLERNGTVWKMKPSVLMESNGSTTGVKKLKQMTLSLTRPEKKHDISMSEKFRGGVANSHKKQHDEEKDVVMPSPERLTRRCFSKKSQPFETMEDPDLTVFQPVVTSTCLPPIETSFDRLPEPQKSPPFKYRRDTVRKREERMKLPGQDCDHCARYYEAAGLDKTQEIRTRMNTCSRHRDKYQIRANTPPGFWDPVLPITPEGSEETAD